MWKIIRQTHIERMESAPACVYLSLWQMANCVQNQIKHDDFIESIFHPSYTPTVPHTHHIISIFNVYAVSITIFIRKSICIVVNDKTMKKSIQNAVSLVTANQNKSLSGMSNEHGKIQRKNVNINFINNE